VRYLIESVHVPIIRGTASASDYAKELHGRRIIHVFSRAAHVNGGFTVEVLTEQDDAAPRYIRHQTAQRQSIQKTRGEEKC
jgi:hypothetical protein